MADPAEVARFKASAKTPADKIRLGEHMLNRNPDRIGPYLLLAEQAPAAMVRNVSIGTQKGPPIGVQKGPPFPR